MKLTYANDSNMATEKMTWEPCRKRWRRTYKKVPLKITAVELGGSCRADTVQAANTWFELEKAKIDALGGAGIVKLHQRDYERELTEIRSQIDGLKAMRGDQSLRSHIDTLITTLEIKTKRLHNRLNNLNLAPLDDTLRNPLKIDPKPIENETERRAIEKITKELVDDYQNCEHLPNWLKAQGYIDSSNYYQDENGFVEDFMVCFEDELDDPQSPESRKALIDATVEQANMDRLKIKVESIVKQKGVFLDRAKTELGLVVDEYIRGRINQRLLTDHLPVPENRKFSVYIQQFRDFQVVRLNQKKIGKGHLAVTLEQINHYERWANVQKVRRIDTVCSSEHVDGYFDFLYARRNGEVELDGQTLKKFGYEYHKKCWSVFKQFVYFLLESKVLPDSTPLPWERSKTDKYRIKKDPRREPEIIPLSVFRKIYEEAPPRLKLFILLIANCACGQSEIGQLRKNEYHPNLGKIIHKRYKTEDHDRAPRVGYKLWERTIELLEQQLEDQKTYPKHPEFEDRLLLNESGKALWRETYEKGKTDDKKYWKRDDISQQFTRWLDKVRETDKTLPKITFYMIRGTVSSVIANNERFSKLSPIWLAHAPTTVADKWYNKKYITILDNCIEWLEGKLFDEPINELDELY